MLGLANVTVIGQKGWTLHRSILSKEQILNFIAWYFVVRLVLHLSAKLKKKKEKQKQQQQQQKRNTAKR